MPLPQEYVRKVNPVAPVKPWVTTCLLLVMVYLFYQVSAHGMLWVKYNAFTPGRFELYRMQGQYPSMLTNMFWASLCPVAGGWMGLVHFLGSAYFLWVFGSLVELRLGYRYFLVLAAMCMFGGWVIQAYEAGLTTYGLYIGPGLLTLGIIGAYLLFFPEKKINPGGTIGRSTRFFRNEPDPDPASAFGIAPWWIISAFGIFQIGVHFWLGTTPLHLDNMHVVAAAGVFVLGLATCAALVACAGHGVSGNPLKILAVQHYRQLRALDIGHDEAVVGTARLMSCPEEKVKEWITKGKGALPST